MTRALCSRISKRKPTKSRHEVIPEDCKENSPLILSQSKGKKQQIANRSCITSLKENTAVGNTLDKTSSNNDNTCLQPTRKSGRQPKSLLVNQDYVYNLPKVLTERHVLCDKTNSPITTGTKSSKLCDSIRSIWNKTNIPSPSQANEKCMGKVNNKTYVPVYKATYSSSILRLETNLPLEKKEAVYEFDEVDENDEPVQKKKRKKRTNIRRPRIGPKALTINNIKYSSSESLVSLPENPTRQKNIKSRKIKPTLNLKSYTSVSNLNGSEDTCYSVQSFMSHPPTLRLCEDKMLKPKHELSILQETQSEEYQDSGYLISSNIDADGNQSGILVDHHQSSNSDNILNVLPSEAHTSESNAFVSQKRCYPSKKSLSNSNTDFHGTSHQGLVNRTPNHVSNCSVNASTASSYDFLSSTPCKRVSLVVCRNSVFDETCDRVIPTGLRPSTGFIKDSSEFTITDDKYFGFDEPEELEEPLLSPIKNTNLQEPRKPYLLHHNLSLSNEEIKIKPDIHEVIEMLKSTIPKAQNKESTQVYSTASSPSEPCKSDSPVNKNMETTSNFIKKPLRRSYERQRRIQHHSKGEEEEEEEEAEEEERHNEKLNEKTPKPVKNCYQKSNVSKTSKAPKITKAKQKIAKEEEEMERLAAQMNAQFQEIDKMNLVVE